MSAPSLGRFVLLLGFALAWRLPAAAAAPQVDDDARELRVICVNAGLDDHLARTEPNAGDGQALETLWGLCAS